MWDSDDEEVIEFLKEELDSQREALKDGIDFCVLHMSRLSHRLHGLLERIAILGKAQKQLGISPEDN